MSSRKEVVSKRVTHNRAEGLAAPVNPVFTQAAGTSWEREALGLGKQEERGEAWSVNRLAWFRFR